ncbi:hypothetical protein X080_02938 [Mycobacterium tuberculosis BTB03-169]|nr:hypothetical protein X080_02938 [Mycobacterium tuberculosis BTB03-169]
MVGKLALGSESSRQTQNPERGRKPISGTATLREDTPSRQTQNPERGRKLNNTFFERGAVESVVRPKTPRGDGNSITLFLSVARLRVSSDPKPREGTETRKRSTSLTILFSRRQT